MVIVDTYRFKHHFCKMTFKDCEDAAFHLVNYESVDDSIGLWIHKTQPGCYALLSFTK